MFYHQREILIYPNICTSLQNLTSVHFSNHINLIHLGQNHKYIYFTTLIEVDQVLFLIRIARIPPSIILAITIRMRLFSFKSRSLQGYSVWVLMMALPPLFPRSNFSLPKLEKASSQGFCQEMTSKCNE